MKLKLKFNKWGIELNEKDLDIFKNSTSFWFSLSASQRLEIMSIYCIGVASIKWLKEDKSKKDVKKKDK